MLPGNMKSGGPLNRENESDVNALFRSSGLPPYYTDITNVAEVAAYLDQCKFHSLSNGVKSLHELRKLIELMTFKDG